MERTLRLIQRAHEGDKEARDILVEENVGLVWSIVRRFQNRGVESEDLFQIGTIGLIKAVDKFDCSYEVCFSTYAVPMIAGEIKRYLRDDGILKVSRSLKETAGKAYRIREQQEKQTGREPTVREIAEILGIPPEELMEAMESYAQVESLQQTIYQGEGNTILLIDKLEEKVNQSEQVLNRLFLEEILGKLEGEERELIYQRYFQEKTQSVIAKEMGISQVQVSKSDVIIDIADEMEKAGLSPEAMNIELTESDLLEGDINTQHFLKELKRMGIKLALDDFGTGYSNFHYLSELDPEIIKIDRSFTSSAVADEKEYYLLKQFCRMIHNLGLKICIEGVENQEEWAKIQKLEPDFGQGFFWGRPCGYDEFVRQFIEKK